MSTSINRSLESDGAVNRVEGLIDDPHTHNFRKSLGVWHVVGLAMADVSPTMAVLLLTAGVVSISGTFTIGACLILSVIVVLIALCLGELSAMSPSAGGMYSIVKDVLPAPVAWITLLNYLLQGIVIPGSLTLGIAIFLKDLFPGIPLGNGIIALIALFAAAAIALTKVEVGAWTTAVMVLVEVSVLGLITVAAILNWSQDLTAVIVHPVHLVDGNLLPVTFAVAITALAPAFNIINGYDAALGFSEEMHDGPRQIGKAVLIAAILASLLITIPFAAAVVAAPDLKTFLASPTPVVYSVEQALGPIAKAVVDIGVIIALFNGALSLLMYFARGVFATGRDSLWPRAVSQRLGSLNSKGVPGWGVLVLVVPAIPLVFVSQLDWLIIFSGTMITAVYFCVGLAALWSRIKDKTSPRPFRMPLWPIPALVVTLFTGFALMQQETQYLIGEVVVIGAGIVLFALSKLWSAPAR
ncbi:APC family permease [Mesorhizobium sp. INR15]|uniref:APC family permease n=1 Tax=Mesorhizobium sp. INR15 TaxID=2654248 RepID=UPI0018967B32|nr:APC family permease [Mesorhizobium sp. INR15]QPC91712.1 amino acid permease [Mesorhizobium sp. INR15]